MPEKILRKSLIILLKALFRVRLRGMEHFQALGGGPAVIIANHQSFLDPLLLAVFLPEKPAFAMNVHQAKKWYFRPLLRLVEVYQVDPAQPMTTKGIIQRLRAGGKVVIFPEGRITTTGGIMKIYEGTGLIIDRTGAPVLPLRIEGAQYSKLSRMKGRLRTRFFPRITLTLSPARKLDLPGEVRGKARRAASALAISDMLVEAGFAARPRHSSLLAALIGAGGQFGNSRKIATDATRAELSYRTIFMKSRVLACLLKRALGKGEAATHPHVGLLLPTSPGGVVSFFALHALSRVPAMLNASAGERAVLSACETAAVEVVVTSRAFIERGRLEGLADAISSRYRLIYLEELRADLRVSDKIAGLIAACFPRRAFHRALSLAAPDAPAAILFTSGSEGMPKGVALSHENILANIHQAAARIAFTERDVMFNALPIFHSFGLSIGTLLPLMLGIRVFLHPSPLHYRVIPELCYDAGATILLGTDTFFSGYARYAHPFDFQSIRLAVAGAERLKPRTRELYAERFLVNILEGYGVTEASPAIAFNTHAEHKSGTVGRIFPGMEAKLEPVEGIEEGGRLLVSGPNVMLGYLRHAAPGIIEPQGRWYDTGDIVTIDKEGYIAIRGRAKRFAKIGGEMVSLAAVEELAAVIWPDHLHAALALADERKGEQVVLLSECPQATREEFILRAREAGLPEIAFPRRINFMEEIPKLGSGKVDYVGLKERVVSPAL